MLPLPLLKSIDLLVVIAMLAQPVLAAVQPAVVRAAPAEAVSQSAPEVATSVEPLTATVPGPLLAGDALPVSSAPVVNQAQVEERLRTSPIMFIEGDNQPTVSAEGKERTQKTFQVRGAGGSIWLAPDAIWVTLLEPPDEETMEERLKRDRDPDMEAVQARAKQPVESVNLRISFDGANPKPRIEGFDPLDTKVSYFIGNDPAKWRTDVPVWGGVRYTNLYPGVDLVVSSKDGAWDWKLEVKGNDGPVTQSGSLPGIFSFDRFLAKPTPEPSPLDAVSLRIEGAEGLDVLSSGEFALQPAVGITTNVGEYALPLLDMVGADPQDITALEPEVIGNTVEKPFADPATPKVMLQSGASNMLYLTLLGGYGEEGKPSIVVDTNERAYVTGDTLSLDYPTSVGAFQTVSHGSREVFVTKLNASGSGLVYSTLLGGSGSDTGTGIAVNANGEVYISGTTASSNFPTTLGSYDTSFGGGTCGSFPCPDLFLTKLNADGTGLTYSTFVGGSNRDVGFGIAIDNNGNAYFLGQTSSGDFPTTPGAHDSTLNGGYDAVLGKMNPEGTNLVYSTFLGSSGNDYATDMVLNQNGEVYITGQTNGYDFPSTTGGFQPLHSPPGNPGWFDDDGFVVKMDASGSHLMYSTFLGASTGYEKMAGIALDGAGSVYVVGYYTYNEGTLRLPGTPGAFQTTSPGAYDAFVAKFSPTLGTLVYFTYLGGRGDDWGRDITVNSGGAAYISGETGSLDFPITPDAFQTTLAEYMDAYVTVLAPGGDRVTYSTFLGGHGGTAWDDGSRITRSASGATYVAGYTIATYFPTTPGAFQTTRKGTTDVFIAKMLLSTDIEFTVNSIFDVVDGNPGDGKCETVPGNEVCTLRAAIMETNALPGEQTVTVPAGHYVLTIEGTDEDASHTGDLDITDDLTLIGGDAATTIIDADGIDRVLQLNHHITVNISGVTIQGGNAQLDKGGGIYVYNEYSSLTLTDSTVSHNQTSNEGGGIYSGHHSGLTLNGTTISWNSASKGGGISVWNDMDLIITNSTVSSNTAVTSGGGIYAVGVDDYDPDISLLNTTLTANSAPLESAALFYEVNVLGGSGRVFIKNTVIANNIGQSCFGRNWDDGSTTLADFHSDGHNLSDDDSCNLTDPTDIITTLTGLDPQLKDNNGGPTPTHALLNGSPAIDQIDPALCPATDQRGVERPQGAKCDIGAYEYDGTAITYGTTRRTGGGSDWPVDNLDKQAQAYVGNPINTANGNQTYETTDLRLPTAAGDIYFSRSYSSFNVYHDWQEAGDSASSLFEQSSLGPGWLHNYETRLYFLALVSDVVLATPGGNRSLFKLVSEDPEPAYEAEDGTSGQMVHRDGRFIYTSSEGIEMVFFDGAQGDLAGKLEKINFKLDGTVDFAYDPDTSQLAAVYDTNHPDTARMEFGYTTYTENTDGSGRSVERLTSVSLADGRSISFEYDDFLQDTDTANYWSVNLAHVIDVRAQQWDYLYADPETHNDPELVLNYVGHPYLRHFLVERRMPPAAGGATIIRYWYEMNLEGETGGVPAARAVREVDGAGQPTVSIKYESIPGTDNAPLIRYGVDLGGENFAGPYIRHEYDSQGRLVQMQTPGGLPGMPTWQTQYAVDPADPEKAIYQPASTTDPNWITTAYTWNSDFLSMESSTNGINVTLFPDGIYSFYQFVSEEAGLHLPELIFYPYAAGGTPQRIQTRLIYNTAQIADPAASYPPATGEPARILNPYDVNTSLPKRLLLAREDDYDPATGQAKFVTRYHYYDAGPRKGLAQCVNSPIPGGDTWYDYYDNRQVKDVYQGCDCTASGGRTGGLHTHITYDALNRVDTTTGPDGMVTRYEYIGQSELVSVVTQNYNAGKGILAEDTNGDTWNIKTRTFYDVAGRLLATIENYHPTYGYGTLVSPDLDKDGSPDSFYLNPLAPHINRATVYDYDLAGRVVQVTANYDGSNLENAASYYKEWPNSEERYNFATRSVYDGAGRVAAVIENYSPGHVGGVPARLLDLDGDGTAETELAVSPDAPDRNRVTLNRYNSLGRLMQVISPAWADASGVFVPYDPVDNAGGQTLTYNRITAYEYDAAGNVIKTIANYDDDLTGELSLSVTLDPGDVTPLHISTAAPDRNIATCARYDVLNRPVFTRAACADSVGAYHTVNGNVYNRVTYTAYDALDRPIVVVGNYDGPADPPLSGDITLTPTATRNHVTRIYYDGLGRAEWVVQNMTGSTGRDIEEVLLVATSDGVDHNLITRAYYDEAGQQIAVVENYRSTDVMLEAGEIGDWLDEGYNHVTRTFYGNDGLPSAVTTNFVGDITGVTSPPAFAPGAPDRNLTTLYQDYDDLNRPVQVSINRWDDHVTNLVRYDNLGRVDWSIFDYDNQPRITHVDYANLGFSVTTEDPAGRVVLTSADVRGNPSTTVAPSGAGYSGLDLTVSNTFDLFGRVTRSEDGVNAAVETSYDALGQVLKVTSDDLVTTYTYNLLGQVVIARTEGTSDGACSATAYQYDNAGQLLRVVENTTRSGGCGVSQVELPRDVETEYSYDEMGNLASVELAHDSTIANGSTKKYQYDALGRAIFEVLDPDGKKLFTRYCYDAAGSVTRTLRGSGQASAAAVPCDTTEPAYLVTAYSYDALGRPTGIDYEQAQAGMTPAANVTFTYDSFGNRKTMTEEGGRTWTYTSTRDGLLESVNWDQGGTPGTPVSYEYDAAGNRIRLTAGTLLDTRYVLDDAGRLDCIDIDGNGGCGSADVDYGYNQASQVTQVALPNSVVSAYTYDPLSRLDVITHSLAGSPIGRFDYDLDGLGNRTGAGELLHSPKPGMARGGSGQGSIQEMALAAGIDGIAADSESLKVQNDEVTVVPPVPAAQDVVPIADPVPPLDFAPPRSEHTVPDAGHPSIVKRQSTIPAYTGTDRPSTVDNQQSAISLAAVTFVVNSTGDGADSNTADGVCNDGKNKCTLRAAIQQANATAGADTIAFNLGSAGPYTIQPRSPLPAVTDPVVIDGASQPGYAGLPRIQIDGSRAGTGASGLTITAGGSTVRALAINRFAYAGIELDTLGGNTLTANFIGTNTAGTAALGNLYGVIILGSSNNTLGGTNPAERNVISGNTSDGIYLDAQASGNLIRGNIVGLDVSGTLDLGNGGAGIYLFGGDDNTIGGTIAGAGNIISGNNAEGISLCNEATGNLVQGNLIGINAAGTAAVPNTGDGVLLFMAGSNTIGGTDPAARNVISGNGSSGVTLTGISASGQFVSTTDNLVQGNFIGTDVTGAFYIGGNHLDGVTIYHAAGNTIGGTSAGARNVISGNNVAGVRIRGDHATGNLVRGNLIGTNAAGTAALGNYGGVLVEEGAPGNTIGGAEPGTGNVISGNNVVGVYLYGVGVTGNQVQGNLIGTDATGTAALGNSDGVIIAYGTDNAIGGPEPGARNVVSGNGGSGIRVYRDATRNLVQGNFIGTDISGTLDLGNGLDGISLEGVPGNTVGGTNPGTGNLISGNGRIGILITEVGADDNIVQGNLVGTDAGGTAALGNGLNGVHIQNGATNALIGGAAPGVGNRIAYNGGAGVYVAAGANVSHSITGNAIFDNAGLGIDLSPAGVTANDPGDADIGPNNLQNYPVLTSATGGGSTTVVDGTLNSTANTTFTLAFYAGPTCDASGYGEGQTYLGSGQVTTAADGNVDFSMTVPTAATDGWAITSTAEDPAGNTSEFSACVTVTSTGSGVPPQSTDPIFDDIDLPHDPALGPVWDGENLTAEQAGAYRAEFGLDGISFVGLAGDQPLSAGARSWLAALRQGETQVDLPAPDPMTGNPDAVSGWLVQDNILLRQRQAGLYEIVVARAQDIELAYLLTAPPVSGASGDLSLILGLDTTLEVVARQEGVYLIDEAGNGIFLGQGTATDASGSSVPVVFEPDEAGLQLFIPEDWLAQATYPILIDPPAAKYVYGTAAQSQTDHDWRYKYDGLGRLTYACSKWDGSKCIGRKFLYTYDKVGNLLRFDRWDGSKVALTRFIIDPGTNQVQCVDASRNGACEPGETWQYDALGNLTSDGASTYTYDTANRLVRVVGTAGTTEYEYNGDGDRIAETHDGERTDFVLDVAAGLTQVLAETTNGQTITYLYGLGLVAQSMNGVTEYNLTDGLGSVRQLTNAGGQVLLSQTFDPYGNRYEQARGSVLWDAASPFGWTGEQFDPSGLTYLRARYYAPSMGRFTQIDPFAGALVVPATMNPYGYAHSSPLMYTDPSGELVLLTALLVGALIGGTLGFGITYGTELYAHRSIIEKEGFWAAQKHLNWGRIGVATAIGAVSGALGYGAGWAATAGMYEVAAGLYAANLAFDIGTDMGVYGDTFLDAWTVNVAFAAFDMPGHSDEMLFKAAGEQVVKSGKPARKFVSHLDDYEGDDWVRQLVRDRRIKAPDGVEFNTGRVVDVQEYLLAQRWQRVKKGVVEEDVISRTLIEESGNISILQAGNYWYLGFSDNLDSAAQAGRFGTRLPRSSTLGAKPSWLDAAHSESNALRELYHHTENLNAVRGQWVNMVGTQAPCVYHCVLSRETMAGQLQNGILGMGLQNMDIWFIRNTDIWPDTNYISTMFP